MTLLQNTTAQWAIGILVALVLFIAGAFVNRYFSKTRKDLSYGRSRWPLIKDEVGSRLQLHFDNKPVGDVSIVMVNLMYKGNEPIRREDYEQEVNFDFEDGARVLSAEVVDVNPGNMKTILVSDSDTQVRLEPVLLNDGNSMTIKMLVENCEKAPSINGRIAGVQRLRNAYEANPMDRMISYIFLNPRRMFMASSLLLALFVLGLIFELPTLAGTALGVAVIFFVFASANAVANRILS